MANGCDPTKRSNESEVPFRICSDRSGRAAFWNFRASEFEKFSKKFWSSSEIPDPATIKEPEANSNQRKRPKKKKSKTKMNPNANSKTEAKPKITNPCDMIDCGKEIVEIPFKYADFKFCTTRCLRAHRFANK